MVEEGVEVVSVVVEREHIMVMGQQVCISVCCFHIIFHKLPVLVFMMHILPNRITCVFELLLFLYTGGGSLGVEIERHVGGGDGYVVIEKARANFVFLYEGAIKQTVTAPKAGRYTITAVGAKGGNCDGCKKDIYECSRNKNCKGKCCTCEAQYNEGGYGALARGTFLLSEGDEIVVRVGGKGQDCERISLSDKNADEVIFFEVRDGAGGGGSTSVTVNHDGGGEDVYVVAGGGGGSASFYNGEDGETGPNGGWEWGGTFGGGGGLSKFSDADKYGGAGGAGGGGVLGNGDSIIGKFKRGGVTIDENGEVWAEGGFSLPNSSLGGYVYRYRNEVDYTQQTIAFSGKAGGYGGGGQGGLGKLSSLLVRVKKLHIKLKSLTSFAPL